MPTNEELVIAYQNGSDKALDQLTEQNAGLLKFVAGKFQIHTSVIDKEDLIQTAWFGLHKAAKSYNPNHAKAAAFSTWAVYWIYQTVSRYAKRKTSQNEISLCTQIGEDIALEDTLPADDGDWKRMWRRLENIGLRHELECVMDENLDMRQKQIARMHYGFDGAAFTLGDIGSMLGISRERTRQIETAGFKKLRATEWGQERAKEFLAEKISKQKDVAKVVCHIETFEQTFEKHLAFLESLDPVLAQEVREKCRKTG